MTKLSIANRTPVGDIKTLWPKETEFSDWLTTEDGLELLAQDLELQIENPRREARGSNFSCDIVANLVGDEKHAVVIENQFGRTNHDHLAKLLTYAATHRAMSGIWIAEEVADDHRQVIDWLNENTPDTIGFYVAECRAYTIGASAAAPHLVVICRPNVTMKQVNSDLTEADKKRRQWRFAFWQEIHQRLNSERLPFRLQKPGIEHWSSIAIGRAGFSMAMLLTPRNQSIAIEVTIQPDGWKNEAFEQLKADSQGIESELGTQLDWRQMPEKGSSKVILESKIDPKVETNRKRVCDWFAMWTPKMFVAFRDRVKKLAAPEGE